jgi:hypothetical protein
MSGGMASIETSEWLEALPDGAIQFINDSLTLSGRVSDDCPRLRRSYSIPDANMKRSG